MCGIAGIFDPSGAAIDEVRLNAMATALDHRGPDERTVAVEPGVGFAIARLAIIDPEGSHQPLSNEAGTVTMVFNGEIYNYVDLRGELERSGHRFATRGDGEVAVHGYEEWGVGVFGRLRGMFAVAIWDASAHRVALGRDRLGIKPLYTLNLGDRFAFASEVKAFVAAGLLAPRLRADVLDSYLAFRYVPAPETAFDGVEKLPPGSYAVLEGAPEGDGEAAGRSAIRVVEYYRPRVVGAPEYRATRPGWLGRVGRLSAVRGGIDRGSPSIGEAADRLYALIERSVRYRLQSDAPLGLFLSAGLDSGFLLALAAKHSRRPLDTFTVGFDRPGIYNETGEAARVADHFGARSHAVRLDAREYARLLPAAVYQMDEPMADPSSVAMMALARVAADRVKVVLSGEGGDELFSGYPRYYGESLALRLGRIAAPGAWVARAMRRRLSRSAARGLEGIGIASVPRRHLHWQEIWRGPDRAALLGASGSTTGDGMGYGGSRARDRLERIESVAETDDPMARLTYFDVRAWLVEDLLLKKDKMGMAASIEARVPYLDQDVVDYALSLPASLKISGRKGKRVFRSLVAQHLPARLLARPKIGFAVPLADWFRTDLRAALRASLLGPDAVLRDWFDMGAIEVFLGRHDRGEDLSLGLFSLWVLDLWARMYLRGESAAALGDALSGR